MEIDKEALTITYEITQKLEENEDAFIWSTIYPYAQSVSQRVLEKKDLEEARMMWNNWKDGHLGVFQKHPFPEEKPVEGEECLVLCISDTCHYFLLATFKEDGFYEAEDAYTWYYVPFVKFWFDLPKPPFIKE